MFAAHTVSNRIARCVNDIANRILKKQKKKRTPRKNDRTIWSVNERHEGIV